jgi:hypothetical protein
MHDSLMNLFKTNFALMQHHKYSLTELEDMIPWERDVYVNLLLAYLQEEERERAKQKQGGSFL